MVTRKKLEILNEECRKLLCFSQNVSVDDLEELASTNETILGAIRKIVIANEFLHRQIICVTGLQGTGKTTLVKNFFGLQDDIVNIAVGRGERLPVLITEVYGQKQVQLSEVGIRKTQDGYENYRELIGAERFKELSGVEKTSSPVMYLEMTIPSEDMSANGRVSYMLLPGYERKNDYWKTLIEFSVHCSDAAVFVVTPSAIAGNENSKLMQKLIEQFGNHIIFVITHSDESESGNEEVKKTLMGLAQIGPDQSNRVVCTGAYANPEHNQKWKNELHDSILSYAGTDQGTETKNAEYLSKIILHDLYPAVNNIETMMKNSTDDLLYEIESSSWLDAFDKMAEKVKKQYKKNLQQSLVQARIQDNQKLRELQKNDKDYLAGIKKTILGKTLEDEERVVNQINEAMQENGRYRYRDAFAQAMVTCTDELCALEDGDDQMIVSAGRKFSVLDTISEEEQQLIVQDMATMLTQDPQQRKPLACKDVNKTMKAIAQMGARYFGLNIVEQLGNMGDIAIPEMHQSNLTMDDVKQSIQGTEKFALSILGITGVDLLGDGVLNFVPMLAQSLAISVGAAAGITTGMVVAGGAVSVIKDYNQMKHADYNAGKTVIADIYERLENDCLNQYDESMGLIRERIENYLIETEGSNRSMLNRRNALFTINNIRNVLDEIWDDLSDDLYAFERAIQ